MKRVLHWVGQNPLWHRLHDPSKLILSLLNSNLLGDHYYQLDKISQLLKVTKRWKIDLCHFSSAREPHSLSKEKSKIFFTRKQFFCLALEMPVLLWLRPSNEFKNKKLKKKICTLELPRTKNFSVGLKRLWMNEQIFIIKVWGNISPIAFWSFHSSHTMFLSSFSLFPAWIAILLRGLSACESLLFWKAHCPPSPAATYYCTC